MAETIFTPSGRDALQAGTFVDDDGERFVGLIFEEPGRDSFVVTLTVPLFQDYVEHLKRVVEKTKDEATWR